MSSIFKQTIRFCMTFLGKRFISSMRCSSSMTMTSSAHSSCDGVTGVSLYSPADLVSC